MFNFGSSVGIVYPEQQSSWDSGPVQGVVPLNTLFLEAGGEELAHQATVAPAGTLVSQITTPRSVTDLRSTTVFS